MTLKAVTGLSDIRPVARCQVQMDRAALAITHQMQFGIQAAPGLADGSPLAVVFFTPLAAIRWVLMWLVSIISVLRSAPSPAKALNMRSNTPASDQRL